MTTSKHQVFVLILISHQVYIRIVFIVLMLYCALQSSYFVSEATEVFNALPLL